MNTKKFTIRASTLAVMLRDAAELNEARSTDALIMRLPDNCFHEFAELCHKAAREITLSDKCEFVGDTLVFSGKAE